jgi:hypothetical protein
MYELEAKMSVFNLAQKRLFLPLHCGEGGILFFFSD